MAASAPGIPGELAALEKKLFASINQLIEPKVRAGWGAPGLVPAGVILLETTGRVSGAPRRVPVMAAQLNDRLLVATFRGRRSQWIKNLAATPRLRYWAGGKAHRAVAQVFDGAGEPAKNMCWLNAALTPSIALGWAFALLTPAAAPRARAAAKKAARPRTAAKKRRKPAASRTATARRA